MKFTPENLTILCSILLVVTFIFAFMTIFAFLNNMKKAKACKLDNLRSIQNVMNSVNTQDAEALKTVPIDEKTTESAICQIGNVLSSHQFLIGLIFPTILSSLLIYYGNALLKMVENTNHDMKLGLARACISIGSLVLFANLVLFVIFSTKTDEVKKLVDSKVLGQNIISGVNSFNNFLRNRKSTK